MDENSRLISTSLAVASGALTVAFESDKINTLGKKLAHNTWPTLLGIAQATLVTSIYYGMSNNELELPMLTAASVFALEAVVEAVSIEKHWTKIAN